MTPEQLLAALNQEAGELRKKALETPGDFTEADADRATEIAQKRADTEKTIQRARDAAAALNFPGSSEPTQTSDDEDPSAEPISRNATLGERFVKSDPYRQFRKDHPSGVGKGTPISIKAAGIGGGPLLRKASTVNTGEQGNARAVRTGEIDDLVYRPERRLLDLITRDTTALPYFQYRQIIAKTNNASIVKEAVTNDGVGAAGGVKPLSTLTTTTAEARAFTYADGMEVTNQELSDDGVMRSIIDQTLRENVEIEVENILLNGLGTADEPAGVFNTSGVLQQAWDTDVPTTIRKAITRLRTTSGANIRGVLLNPTDDETWDLLKDAQGRYLGNGPFAPGIGTAWGYERITSQSIPVGRALIGDFSTIFLLQLEALSVEAFNQHKDYAQRNLVYVRAEERNVQLIRNAARLCVVDLDAAI